MILITGGSGFLGTYFAQKLLDAGHEVRIYDLIDPIPELKERVSFIKGDVCDRETFSKAMDNVDIVWHCAAKVPLTKAGKDFLRVNRDGSRIVGEVALKNNVKKFIHISSSAVCDVHAKMPLTEETPEKPVGTYGHSKYLGENEILSLAEKGLPAVIIRPRTIIGPFRLGIFEILYDWIHENKKIYTVGSGENAFQLISAEDLYSACYCAMEKEIKPGSIFNIGNEAFGSYNDLISDLITYAGSESKIVHLHAGMTRSVLKILDKLHLSPLADWHYETLDKPIWFDITKAKEELQWAPVDSNSEMIWRNYDWYLRHRDAIHSMKGSAHRSYVKQQVLKFLKMVS
jgi:nucleoside-diphosphate-sugar epimerase